LIDRFNIWNGPLLYAIALVGAVASWGVIAVLRLAEPGPTDRTLVIHGVYDEVGHLLTALMIALGLAAVRLPIPIWSVLLGGMVLDLGHLLTQLDVTEPIAGSSRNGTHSVFAVILLALVGFIDRRHANVWLGITLGAITHLWRDMGTGFVPLAWPLSDRVWGTSFTRYMIGLIGVALAMIGSGALLEVHSRANGEQRGRFLH
jgi:membrane-bound metal-dependent hydrolase YbcI (DUF457 family)